MNRVSKILSLVRYLICLLILFLDSFSQLSISHAEEWTKKYGVQSAEISHFSVLSNGDGTYDLVETKRKAPASLDLCHLDGNGQITNRTHGSIRMDNVRIRQATKTDDGGILVLGIGDSLNENDLDQKASENISDESQLLNVATSDDNQQNATSSSKKMFVLKFTKSHKLEFQIEFILSELNYMPMQICIRSEGFAVNVRSKGARVFEFGPKGMLQRGLLIDNWDHCSDMRSVRKGDSEYLLIGTNGFASRGEPTATRIILSSKHNLPSEECEEAVWSKAYKSRFPSHRAHFRKIYTIGSESIVIGELRNKATHKVEPLVLKLSKDGNVIWSRLLEASESFTSWRYTTLVHSPDDNTVQLFGIDNVDDEKRIVTAFDVVFDLSGNLKRDCCTYHDSNWWNSCTPVEDGHIMVTGRLIEENNRFTPFIQKRKYGKLLEHRHYTRVKDVAIRDNIVSSYDYPLKLTNSRLECQEANIYKVSDSKINNSPHENICK